MVPADFGIEVSKYNKRDDGEIVGLVHYTSEEEGVRVDLFNGFVQNLFLSPRKADEALRCKQSKYARNTSAATSAKHSALLLLNSERNTAVMSPSLDAPHSAC